MRQTAAAQTDRKTDEAYFLYGSESEIILFFSRKLIATNANFIKDPSCIYYTPNLRLFPYLLPATESSVDERPKKKQIRT